MIVTKVAAMARGAFWIWTKIGCLVATSAPKAASMANMAAFRGNVRFDHC